MLAMHGLPCPHTGVRVRDSQGGVWATPCTETHLVAPFVFWTPIGSLRVGFGFGIRGVTTTVQIKLVGGDSAGTITAFYMSSDGPTHNEFDFEFLGNTTGEPYIVQTNVYVNGVGNREQRLSLWFDPTTEFHAYSILWNQHQVVFLVDETPIRVFSNKEAKGLPFPKDQAMGVYSSIWNADDWATQGGRVKTDWSHAPFVASYKGFDINGCEVPFSTNNGVDNSKKCSATEGKYWWDEPVMAELNVHQSHHEGTHEFISF
ncbi:xyloglucan:xyloglucosyl transferase [Ranunculus cassubicifolius]